MTVKFASFNIQYGVGQDGRHDLARAADAVRDADIVCVQEATTAWRACDSEDQPRQLAQRLDLYSAYAPAYEIDASARGEDGRVVDARRGFGNMVLSRWPILYSRPHSLPRPATEVPPEFHPRVDFPRVALEAVIDCGGRPVRVFSIHLSHRPGKQRMAQIDALRIVVSDVPAEAPLWEADPRIAAWSEDSPAPAIPRTSLLFGDFNFEPDDRGYRRMLEPIPGVGALMDGWKAARSATGPGPTCVESDGRLSRLDYLFATADMTDRIVSARVDRAVTASDHFPVLFEIDLSP